MHSKAMSTEITMQNTNALKLCFLLVVSLVNSSCMNQESVSRYADTADVYALVSIDGISVPASVSHQGANLQVLSGTFTIKPDGTCNSKTIFIPPSGTEVVREVTARYTQDDARLTMQWKGAGKTVGTIHGNTFTMNNEGMVFVYKK